MATTSRIESQKKKKKSPHQHPKILYVVYCFSNQIETAEIGKIFFWGFFPFLKFLHIALGK